MKRYHATEKGLVPFSDEEELAWNVKQAEWSAGADFRKGAEIRAERNAKLAVTDWTQITDATVDKTAWGIYRQALRDIPAQSGFPNNVTWPDAP